QASGGVVGVAVSAVAGQLVGSVVGVGGRSGRTRNRDDLLSSIPCHVIGIAVLTGRCRAGVDPGVQVSCRQAREGVVGVLNGLPIVALTRQDRLVEADFVAG